MFPTHSAGSWPAVALLCCSDALVLGCSSDAMVLGCSSDALALGCSSTSTVGAVLAVGAVGEEKKLLELMLPGTAMWVKEGRMPTCPWLRRHGVAPGKGSTAAQLSHRAVQGEHRHRILEAHPAPPQGFCSLQPSHAHRDVRADHSPPEANRHPKAWVCPSQQEQGVCEARATSDISEPQADKTLG